MSFSIQVLIAAYGPAALEEIAALPHPEFPGVEYIVGWQNYNKRRIPGDISGRKDFKIIFENSVGLCNNRNQLTEAATADIIVVADDDLAFSENHFKNILTAVGSHPDTHFFTFRYESDAFPKQYPSFSFDLSKPPTGYFVTSMELVFNRTKINEEFGPDTVRFNPLFGVNGILFSSGEEDVLVHSLLAKGLKGRFIPLDICVNTDSTTGDRIGATKEFIETKGAVMRLINPSTRFLRMLTHAWRSRSEKGATRIGFLRYCRWWVEGDRKIGRAMKSNPTAITPDKV